MKKWTVYLILILFIFLCLPHSDGQEKHQNPGELYDLSTELYYKDRCEEAIEGFSKIIQSAPTSTLVSYSQYMIGLCSLKMGKYEERDKRIILYDPLLLKELHRRVWETPDDRVVSLWGGISRH